MFDDGLLRASELFVAEHVLQDGMGGDCAEGTRWTKDALNLIAASAFRISLEANLV